MDRIKENFTESIQTKIAAAEALTEQIQTAAQMLTISLLNGNKIIVITSYSIHYTKLYELPAARSCEHGDCAPLPRRKASALS